MKQLISKGIGEIFCCFTVESKPRFHGVFECIHRVRWFAILEGLKLSMLP